jgi:hypothetical protein
MVGITSLSPTPFNGIANYPDPKPIGNYGVVVQIPKSLGIDQSSPPFVEATKACRLLLKVAFRRALSPTGRRRPGCD